MELNKVYKVSEYSLEELEPGTIVRIINSDNFDSLKNDLVIICEPGAEWKGTKITALSITDAEFYIGDSLSTSINTYKIVRFKK